MHMQMQFYSKTVSLHMNSQYRETTHYGGSGPSLVAVQLETSYQMELGFSFSYDNVRPAVLSSALPCRV